MRSTWEPAFERPTNPQRLIRLLLRRRWLTDTRDPDYSIGRLMTGYCPASIEWDAPSHVTQEATA
jgi:hypothetical protein